jgi:hypothetical protein
MLVVERKFECSLIGWLLLFFVLDLTFSFACFTSSCFELFLYSSLT